ncbi:hypothetical protein ACGF5F_16565 [Streptomyces sp. NPDC047821]|uniref:hypothetical protein n=1 Tax=Streptomyces sp. NPDC047821 TaxID=3365488 RepID=UPI00371AE999
MGPGADWALETLPALLGAEDDPAKFTARHRIVAQAVRWNPGLRLTRTGLAMEALVASVLEQKVSTREAFAAWRRLLLRYGEARPGPAPDGMRVPPTPRQWSVIPSWEWHRVGVDDKRASAILRAMVATRHASKSRRHGPVGGDATSAARARDQAKDRRRGTATLQRGC